MHKVEVTTSSRNDGNTVLPAALSVEQGNCLIAEFMGMERTEKETGEPTFKQEKNAVIWASQLMYKHEQLGVIERTKKQVVLTEIGRSIKLN